MQARDNSIAQFNRLVQAYKDLEEKNKKIIKDTNDINNAITNLKNNIKTSLEASAPRIATEIAARLPKGSKINYEEIVRKVKEAMNEAKDYLESIPPDVAEILSPDVIIPALVIPDEE